MRPRPLGQQRRHAPFLPGAPRLVEGHPGEPEAGRAGAHLVALGARPAQHLVFDLGEIAGVEEGVLEEEFVADPVRVGVETAVLAEGGFLGVGGELGHRGFSM